MTDSSIEDLMNTLWLLSRSIEEQVRHAHQTAADFDSDLLRAIDTLNGTDLIARESFLEPSLIDHVRNGGSSLRFILNAQHPDES